MTQISPEAVANLIESLKNPTDARAFLREAGLIDESGQLTDRYRTPVFRVELTYFKTSGKFYDQGFFDVDGCLSLNQIWDAVERARETGTLPGLVEGAREFIILVSVPGHPHDHPKLLFP